MSEKMYVVQIEAWFNAGVTDKQADEALEEVAENAPFGIQLCKDPSGRYEFKEVEYVDNCEHFEPRLLVDAFKRFKAKGLTNISALYIWEMDIDHPKYHIS